MPTSFFRGRVFGFEIQHIILLELRTNQSPAARRARS